ncbi:MAG TPA: TolC family protein [Verrucomicrobiota bacterium]|nr:TolC family protein [Verrucomicrobiota bacterium]HNU50819.1 TolC family protein [Verrucomicrobiota bacterium]
MPRLAHTATAAKRSPLLEPTRATPLGTGHRSPIIGLLGLSLLISALGRPATPESAAPPWLDRPLTVADCLNLAFDQNAEVRKSRQDLEATHGVMAQTRAIVWPKLRAAGDYGLVEEQAVDRYELPINVPGVPSPLGIDPGTQRWAAGVRIIQSFYEGGRMTSALRTARLLREQAVARHMAVLSDTATDVRVAYYNVLLAQQEVRVSEASVELLEKELEDSQRRFTAGTVPRFNVLRAEVELANARPRVSRARNAYRITREILVQQLGYAVPQEMGGEIPLQLVDTLDVPHLELDVTTAVRLAKERRPELVALRKNEALRQEDVQGARAGRRPRLEGYAGYGVRKSNFSSDVDDEVHGWEVGVQAVWNLFDGHLTRGKIQEAQALLEKSQIETDDVSRKIELEVRSACSTLVEAWEVLESQRKVLEQADEALRLARARADAGTGTQLDVLGAQTALTDARTTDIRARRDYAVARARVERATGASVPDVNASPGIQAKPE